MKAAKKLVLIGIFMVLFLFISMTYGAAKSHAVVIVDTGVPSNLAGGSGLGDISPPPGAVQWLAAEIVLSQSYNVTKIQGFFADSSSSIFDIHPGSLTMAVYGDGGDVPNPSVELFSGVFTVPNVGVDIFETSGNWYGLSNLNLNLVAGEYWVAFEVRSGNTYDSFMPNSRIQLLNEAFFDPTRSPDWIANDFINMGLIAALSSPRMRGGEWRAEAIRGRMHECKPEYPITASIGPNTTLYGYRSIAAAS